MNLLESGKFIHPLMLRHEKYKTVYDVGMLLW